MQHEAHLGGRAGPQLDPVPGGGRDQRQQASIPACERSMAASAENVWTSRASRLPVSRKSIAASSSLRSSRVKS